jgi:replicative DNA helicase
MVSIIEPQLIPQDINIEKYILGGLLINFNKQVIDTIEFLNDNDFYIDTHQKIFKTIKIIIKDINTIDLALLINKLNSLNYLDNITLDASYISNLTSNISSNANLIYYAKILKQISVQRQILLLCDYYKNESYKKNIDVADIIDNITKDLNKIINDLDKESFSKSNLSVVKTFFDEKRSVKGNTRKLGYDKFDNEIKISPNKIILLSGHAKAGKSRMMCNIMFRLLENYNDISVFWITLEDSAFDILATYLSYKTGLTREDIKNKTYDDKSFALMKEHIERFKTFDIEYIEESAKISKMNLLFQEFCKNRKNRFPIFILDNILSMSDRDDFKNNDNSMYDYVMQESLRIRQRTKATIFIIHHFKDSQMGENKLEIAYRPRLTDLKGTEAFRRVPNQVLMINYPPFHKDLINEYKGEQQEILKHLLLVDSGANRDGGTDDDFSIIRFFVDYGKNKFMEI